MVFNLLKIITLSIFVSLGIVGPSMADILVAPTRVVLEERDRAAELTIVNKGTERQIFRVMVENRRMLEDGSFETALDARPGELPAAEMLRYAPRRVVLEPGERQTVRLMARRPRDLPPGEYRSHLRLMSAPEDAGLSIDRLRDQQTDRLSISLMPIRSITIPVIVRKGALDVDVGISEARIDAPGAGAPAGALFLRLDRQGTQSSFGHIEITGGGQAIASLRGVAVYVPNQTRTLRIPLTPQQRSMLAGRMVDIAYVSADEESPEVYARTSVLLN